MGACSPIPVGVPLASCLAASEGEPHLARRPGRRPATRLQERRSCRSTTSIRLGARPPTPNLPNPLSTPNTRPGDKPPPPGQQQVAADIPDRVGWALLVLGLLLLFSILPHGIGGDGRLRFDALQGWLEGRGIPDTKYPLIGSVPAIPLMLLGHLGAPAEWLTARYNVIVYAAGLVGLYLLLRGGLAN